MTQSPTDLQFSQARLAAMKAHGWTPTDVRDLIAAYTALVQAPTAPPPAPVACEACGELRSHSGAANVADLLAGVGPQMANGYARDLCTRLVELLRG